VYERRIGTERWRVGLNFRAEPVAVPLDGLLRASSDPDRTVGGALAGRFELGPEEGVLVEVRST
jgi:hypothetical protein